MMRGVRRQPHDRMPPTGTRRVLTAYASLAQRGFVCDPRPVPTPGGQIQSASSTGQEARGAPARSRQPAHSRDLVADLGLERILAPLRHCLSRKKTKKVGLVKEGGRETWAVASGPNETGGKAHPPKTKDFRRPGHLCVPGAFEPPQAGLCLAPGSTSGELQTRALARGLGSSFLGVAPRRCLLVN